MYLVRMERIKMAKSYYEKPIHQRLAQRVFEGLVSTAAVYLFAPQLLTFLTPLQAKLNANALSNGQTPTTNGVSAIANLLIQPPAPAGTVTVPATPPPVVAAATVPAPAAGTITIPSNTGT